MKKTKVKTADALLLGGILVAGCVLALCLLLTQHKGAQVQVRVNGTVIETFSLSQNRRYEISGVNGGTNLLVIENGVAWVEEASCPDGLCRNMGKVSTAGQSIVCLPNKVVVEVIGDQDTTEAASDVDLIAG